MTSISRVVHSVYWTTAPCRKLGKTCLGILSGTHEVSAKICHILATASVNRTKLPNLYDHGNDDSCLTTTYPILFWAPLPNYAWQRE